MKILAIGQEWFEQRAGGANRYFFNLYSELAAQGHEILALTTGDATLPVHAPFLVRFFARSEAPILWRVFSARREVRRALLDFKPDVVVAHFAPYVVSSLSMLGKDRPFVVHFHGPWFAESSVERAHPLNVSVKRYIEAAVYRRAHRIVVLSQAFRNVLADAFPVDKSRIVVVPGMYPHREAGKDLQDRATARHELGWSTQRKILFVARRLVRRMGLMTLLVALRKLGRDDVDCYIAGKGPLEGELITAIDNYGLGGRVKMLGRVSEPDLAKMFIAADATVVPSQALEGFGLVAAESLAAGTPCLVTPIGGLPEVVQALEPRLIFSGSEVTDITSGLQAFLDSNGFALTRERCREHAAKHFSPAVVARQMADVYGDTL